MALIVALGGDRRSVALGLLVALHLVTNFYAGACIAQLVGFWPEVGFAGLAWTHRLSVILITLLVAAALALVTTGVARPLSIVAVVTVVGAQLLRGCRATHQRPWSTEC
jgi:hypothetical protein